MESASQAAGQPPLPAAALAVSTEDPIKAGAQRSQPEDIPQGRLGMAVLFNACSGKSSLYPGVLRELYNVWATPSILLPTSSF